MKIYLPLDAAAKALGADEIAAAILTEAARRGVKVDLIRNGSRGMVFLEPLAEVVTPAGRMAFGPMTVKHVPALFDDLASHPLALGLTDDLPWMKAQTRLTFARCGAVSYTHLDVYKRQSSTKQCTGTPFSSARRRIRAAISADCTGEPPGELITSATASGLERNAFSITVAKA